MFAGAALLLTLFVVPIWNITLEAPQYPVPIGMDIYINKFKGVGEYDIQNINIMNHYVGMKEIPVSIPEFDVFPMVVGGLVLLGILFSLIGKRVLYMVWLSLTILFGVVAMYDFYQWEYEYGHDLNDHAAIKFTDENGDPMTYQPPLIGAKTILNFRAISVPRIGAYLLFLGMCLSGWAFIQARKETVKKWPIHALMIPFLIGLISCEVKPGTMTYGTDVCAFCQMTLVDKQHAAQFVTEKGKVYRYDAIECMMNDLASAEAENKPPVKFYMVADYANPGELIEASKAHFLITQGIPSPMGGFLSAFAERADLEEILEEHGGETLSWTQLQKKYEQ